MKASATLSSKFQISVPKSIREKEGWTAGQRLAFIPKNGGVMLAPVPEFEDLVGLLPDADPTNSRDRDDRY